MQEALGAYYRPGDYTRVWTAPGRSEFGDTGTGEAVDGVILALVKLLMA
jgi:hypothetical protein